MGQQPLPDGPIILGIDGGYVRAAHRQGWFEVIAGRRVVAFRRDDESNVPSAKCFGYVQTYDEKPRRRLWELMKSQRIHTPENDSDEILTQGLILARRIAKGPAAFSQTLGS